MAEEVTAAQFYADQNDACFTASTGPALVTVNIEDLMKESGGELTFDAARSKCAGGPGWRDDPGKKLAAASVQPIEYPEKGPFRFGAPKVVYGVEAALIPRAVNGKELAVRTSVARGAALESAAGRRSARSARSTAPATTIWTSRRSRTQASRWV